MVLALRKSDNGARMWENQQWEAAELERRHVSSLVKSYPLHFNKVSQNRAA